mgnify:CR=1 FL=1
MVEITLTGDVAQRLQELAARDKRSVEEWLWDNLIFFNTPLAERTPLFETDEQRQGRKAAAFRRVRTKTYERARRYWGEVGDLERLALTDIQLDEQFWVIDPEGIPRLKSEQGNIELPPNPFLEMAENAERLNLGSGRSDISENFGEIVGALMTEEYFRRQKEQSEEDNERKGSD